MPRALRPLPWLPLIALLAACGAEGTDAPATEGARLTCPGLDERLTNVLETLRAGELSDLEVVLDRLTTEREGVRLERALQFALGLLQALPRREAEGFEYALVYELLDETRGPAVGILDFLADGPPERRALFSVVGDMFVGCARDSLIVTVNDLFEDPNLLSAAGEALNDRTVVSLLANVPGGSGGRAGFVALIRTVVNALQSPSFDFVELRELVGFLDLDEPPVSGLLDALEDYLRGDRLANLGASLACLEVQSWQGVPGVDVFGGFLYDLITLDGLDLGELLSLASPLLEELREPNVQTLLKAIIDELLANAELRDLGIELVAFLLRDDNAQPVLRAAATAFATRGIDDVLRLFEGLTVRCRSASDARGG